MSFIPRLDLLLADLEGLAGAVMFPALLYLGSRLALTWTVRLHWIVGAFLSILFGVLVALLLFGMTATFFRNFPARVTLSLFASIVLLAANVCSAWSFILFSQGWASYESSRQLDPGAFADLYLWHFIDMIPGFKVWETLGVQAPIIAKGPIAGLPLLAFRVCVGLPILALFVKWYDLVKSKGQPPPGPG